MAGSTHQATPGQSRRRSQLTVCNLLRASKPASIEAADFILGRSMVAKRAGLAVQRRYRLEGRDATARATICPVIKQNARKLAREGTELGTNMGLPEPARVKYLSLD